MDKVAAVALITIQLFSVVMSTAALTGREITVDAALKCTLAINGGVIRLGEKKISSDKS